MLAYNQRVSGPFSQPINASTRYCAVYGFPVKHSASPAMQNAGLAALGLNWRYLAFEVDPDNLRAAIQGAQAMNLIGLNLTVPHKLLAVDLVDVLDDSAKSWGAVNTIRFEGRDERGAWRPLREFADAPTGNPRARVQHRCRGDHTRAARGLGIGVARRGESCCSALAGPGGPPR